MWSAAALELSLRIPLGDSLKAKRAVIRPILDGAHRRYGVASAEVADQDVHDRAVLERERAVEDDVRPAAPPVADHRPPGDLHVARKRLRRRAAWRGVV